MGEETGGVGKGLRKPIRMNMRAMKREQTAPPTIQNGFDFVNWAINTKIVGLQQKSSYYEGRWDISVGSIRSPECQRSNSN